MDRVLEGHEVQLALMQAIDNTNVTGKYFDMRGKRDVVAIMTVLDMAATKTAKIELVQDKDGDGGDVKAITGAEKTVTALTEDIESTITLATFVAGGKITINGLVFTAHTDTTTVADREFAIDGNDTADAAELVTCINDATYGVPGVTASSAAGVVSLVADDGYTITVTEDVGDGTITLATVEAIAMVDVAVIDLDLENEFYFVAPKVTTTATTTAVSVVLATRDHYHNKVSQPSPHKIL